MTKHTESDSNCSTNTSSRCADLPDDLIIEVLSRLPGKTQLTFMCVSKSWRNFISNSLPISPMSSLFLFTSCYKKPLFSLYFKERQAMSMVLMRSGCSTVNYLKTLQSHCTSLRNSHPKITVLHYCNGLFLFSDVPDFGTSYYVSNPATNQCVGLPKPHPFPSWRTNQSALVFDPKKSSHFKVVFIYDLHGKPYNKVEGQIFSSDKNQWVSFISYFETSKYGVVDFWGDQQPVYFKGALHFLCRSRLCMFRFYVEEKRLREFKIPKRGDWFSSECLGESEGHLFYATSYGAKLQIWMLQDFDTNKWFKKHTLNIGKAISPSTTYITYTMAFHTNLEVLFIKHDGVVYSYYFGRSSRKDIDRLKEVCNIEQVPYPDYICPYSPCLASLNKVCKWRST